MAPVAVVTSTSTNYSLIAVNGNPAIVYIDDSGSSIKYIRATDVNGSSWGSPVTIDSNIATVDFSNIGFSNVSGSPAVAYRDATANNLKYARATDVNGSSWGSPVVVDSNNSQFPSLRVINGNPAISYKTSLDKLGFVRAADSTGSSWNTPVTAASPTGVGQGTSLAVVDGNPAISFLDNLGLLNGNLAYVRATNVNGSSWGTPVAVHSSVGNFIGQYSSLVVVSSRPAIAYQFLSTGVYYVRANDAQGIAWGTPVQIASG
jgi:hypothetical protein